MVVWPTVRMAVQSGRDDFGIFRHRDTWPDSDSFAESLQASALLSSPSFFVRGQVFTFISKRNASPLEPNTRLASKRTGLRPAVYLAPPGSPPLCCSSRLLKSFATPQYKVPSTHSSRYTCQMSSGEEGEGHSVFFKMPPGGRLGVLEVMLVLNILVDYSSRTNHHSDWSLCHW